MDGPVAGASRPAQGLDPGQRLRAKAAELVA